MVHTCLHTNLSSMNTKQFLKTNLKLLLPAVLFSLLCLTAWRDILVFWEYHNNNVITVTSKCISVSKSTTNEPRRHYPFTILCLNLEDGTVVAIYEETATELTLSENVTKQLQVLEERFVTGLPTTFTYVAKPPIVDDTYALVCASSLDGNSLIDAATGISHYASRAKAVAILNIIFYGIPFLLFAAQLFFRLYKKWKKWNRRRKRKRKKNR